MRNLAKVAAAGATIFVVGLGITVLQPEPEAPVAEAQADIFGFSFAPQSQQQRFVETLKREGLEEPRVYNHNGNQMFFSTTTTTESPREVLERFQRAFVENKVNEGVHLSTATAGPMPSFDELIASPQEAIRQLDRSQSREVFLNDMLNGLVPVDVNPDRVVMMGMTTNKEAESYHDWVQEVADMRAEIPAAKADMDLSKTVKAMRYLDAFREGSNKTRITALWSDEEYEAGKIADIGEDLNIDPEVPSCIGCKRLYNITGETESNYSVAAYDARGNSIDQVMTFYHDALTARGWQVSETKAVLDAAERSGMKPRSEEQLVQYARGGEFMTLTAWSGDAGTRVHLSRSN